MHRWLNPALDYISRWIDFQMRLTEQPGCAIAVAHRGEIIFEQAFGHANLSSGEPLTPRHRFRVASHSKSFTAAGIMKLREQGKLRLDRCGRALCRCATPGGCRDDDRSVAVAQRRHYSRRR